LFEECTLQLNIKVDVIGGDTTSSQKDWFSILPLLVKDEEIVYRNGAEVIY
jgi:thiamine monophosphate kinase